MHCQESVPEHFIPKPTKAPPIPLWCKLSDPSSPTGIPLKHNIELPVEESSRILPSTPSSSSINGYHCKFYYPNLDATSPTEGSFEKSCSSNLSSPEFLSLPPFIPKDQMLYNRDKCNFSPMCPLRNSRNSTPVNCRSSKFTQPSFLLSPPCQCTSNDCYAKYSEYLNMPFAAKPKIIQHCKFSIPATCLSSSYSQKAASNHRRHSDPGLTTGNYWMRKLQEQRHSLRRSFFHGESSPKKNIPASYSQEHSFLINEICKLKDMNCKLWHHLREADNKVKQLELMKSGNADDWKTKPEFSALLAEIYYAQKERDEAGMGQIAVYKQERDLAIDKLNKMMKNVSLAEIPSVKQASLVTGGGNLAKDQKPTEKSKTDLAFEGLENFFFGSMGREFRSLQSQTREPWDDSTKKDVGEKCESFPDKKEVVAWNARYSNGEMREDSMEWLKPVEEWKMRLEVEENGKRLDVDHYSQEK